MPLSAPDAAAPPDDAPAVAPEPTPPGPAVPAMRRPAGPRLAGKARAPWSEVILLASLSMFGSVAMDMYLPALPGMASALRAGPRAAQATISVFLFGLAFGQLVFGPLSDRVGRRPPILAGVALFLLASGACAASTGIGALIAARLLQALGSCAGMVVSRAVVRDRYDDHEVLHVFSLLSLVFGVAPIVAPLVGGWVLAVSGWRAIFGVQAAFGLVTGLVAYLRLPESRSERTREQARSERPWTSYAALLRQPLLTGYLLTGALSGAALFSYITAAPQVVITEFHIPPAHFGWVFGANSAGWIGASQLNARLARRVSGESLLQGALLAALTASLLLAASAWTRWGGVWGVLVPLFVVISCMGFSQPNATAAAMSVDRHRAGATAALLGAAFFGVGSLAGAASGLVRGTASQAMSTVIVGSLLLALLAYRTLVRPRARRRDAASGLAAEGEGR